MRNGTADFGDSPERNLAARLWWPVPADAPSHPSRLQVGVRESEESSLTIQRMSVREDSLAGMPGPSRVPTARVLRESACSELIRAMANQIFQARIAPGGIYFPALTSFRTGHRRLGS